MSNNGEDMIIYPTTIPAVVLGQLTLPIALRHLDLHEAADELEESPELMAEVSLFCEEFMTQPANKAEAEALLTLAKPVILFLFLKELVRLSPERYGFLENEAIPQILEVARNHIPMIEKQSGGSPDSNIKKLRDSLINYRTFVTTTIPEPSIDQLNPFRSRILKLKGDIEVIHNIKISTINFEDLENIDNFVITESGVKNTRQKKQSFWSAKNILMGVGGLAVLAVMTVTGAVMNGEAHHRAVEENAAYVRETKSSLEANLNFCKKDTTYIGWIANAMVGVDSCSTAIKPVISKLNASHTLLTELTQINNPVWYLNQTGLFGESCIITGITFLDSKICKMPIGRFDPTAALPKLRSIVDAVTFSKAVANGQNLPKLTTDQKKTYDEYLATLDPEARSKAINEATSNIVERARLVSENVEKRTKKMKEKAREEGPNMLGNLLQFGAAVAVGASGVAGAGKAAKMLSVVGKGLGLLGRIVPALNQPGAVAAAEKAEAAEEAKAAKSATARAAAAAASGGGMKTSYKNKRQLTRKHRKNNRKSSRRYRK